MISDRLLRLLCCPSCRGSLSEAGRRNPPSPDDPGGPEADLPPNAARAYLQCLRCRAVYSLADGYADVTADEPGLASSKYSSSEFEEQLDYRDVGEPLLAAGVRQRQLERMLPLAKEDSMIDLGCGNGKFALWNKDRCGYIAGVDSAALFAERSLQEIDLVRGDARRLPFADGSFSRALSIDVLEHFSAEDVDRYLGEAWRVLRPGGLLFVYSNTRERGRYRWLIDLERSFSERLAGFGLVDSKADMLRKSDHVKAIATLEELQTVSARAGFQIREIVFWNGILQGLVENIMVKLAEGAAYRLKRRRRHAGISAGKESGDRQILRRSVGRRPSALFLLRMLTGVMSLDLYLWGGSRTGPFFAVLEKRTEAGEP